MSSTPPPPPPPGGFPPAPPPGAPMVGAPGQSAFGPLASWGERVVAYLIDWLILVVLYIVVFIVSAIFGAISSTLGWLVLAVGYLGLLAASFYLYYLNGSIGQTPGKKVMGLKVINEQTGQLIGGGAGIGRGFLHIVDGIICYIGFLFPLWDAKRQTISDKIMHTVVTNNTPKVPFVDAVKSVLPSK